MCLCCILLLKATPEMTYTVSGGTLNPTHSLTQTEETVGVQKLILPLNLSKIGDFQPLILYF